MGVVSAVGVSVLASTWTDAAVVEAVDCGKAITLLSLETAVELVSDVAVPFELGAGVGETPGSWGRGVSTSAARARIAANRSSRAAFFDAGFSVDADLEAADI